MFNLADLIAPTLVLLAAWYWWSSQGIKETAFKAAKQHCEKMEVMLLDESLVLRAIWFKKDNQRRLRLWRRYLFDFTATGTDRYEGQVIILGQKITHIQLAPHRI